MSLLDSVILSVLVSLLLIAYLLRKKPTSRATDSAQSQKGSRERQGADTVPPMLLESQRRVSEHGVMGMKWGERHENINKMRRLVRDPRSGVNEEERDEILSHLDKAEQAGDIASASHHYGNAGLAYARSLQRNFRSRHPSFWQGLWDAMRSGYRKGQQRHKDYKKNVLGIGEFGRSRRLSRLLLVLVALLALAPVLDRSLLRNGMWWKATVPFAVIAFFHFAFWLRAWFERKLIKPEGNQPTTPPEARGISGGEGDERPEFIEFAKGEGFKLVSHRPKDDLGSYFKHDDGSRLNLYKNGTWTHYSPAGKKTEGKGIARLKMRLGQ